MRYFKIEQIFLVCYSEENFSIIFFPFTILKIYLIRFTLIVIEKVFY